MAKVLQFGRTGNVIETEGETVSPPVAAGEPAKPAADKPALAEQLGSLAQNALTAQNRLTNLVDPTQCADKVQLLVTRYGELQSRLAAMAPRIAELGEGPDAAAAVEKDLQALSVDVQGYIEAVEALVKQYPIHSAVTTTDAGAAAKRTAEQKARMLPYMLLGGMAILIAGGGYLIWRQRKTQERATQRATRRAIAATTRKR